MRSALEQTDGVREVTLLPSMGTGRVVAEDTVSSELLLTVINSEDVTARTV